MAANAPALTWLYLRGCRLRDRALGPILLALKHNTHLRTLLLSGNKPSDDFRRTVLEPAAAASGGVLRI